MNDRDRYKSEMIARVKVFFDERAADFAANTVAKNKIASLKKQAIDIAQLNADHLSSKTNVSVGFGSIGERRDDVRDALRDVCDFARAMSDDIPALEHKFRMPRGNNSANLVATARSFAVEAAAFQADFISYGMPADFIDGLNDKADALEQALAQTESATQNRTGARSEISQTIRDAVKLVHALDPIVRMIYRNDAANFAAWMHASHVERAPASPAAPLPQPPQPPV